MDDQLLEKTLGVGPPDQMRLNRVGGDEPVDDDRLLLADAVAAILGLEIHLRVLQGQRIPAAAYPIAVVEDDGVGGGEIDAEATGARADEENLDVGVAIEVLDLLLARILAHGAVDAAELPLVQVHQIRLWRVSGGELARITDDVDDLSELRKDEDAMIFGNQLVQQFVEQQHLSRVIQGLHRVVDVLARLLVVRGVEQDGVVARLAKLHHHVLQVQVADVFP